MRVTLLALALFACRQPIDSGTPIDADEDGSPAAEDCNDGDAAVFPGAEEVCNGVDDDCSGAVDDDATDASTFYTDGDADGFGDAARPLIACDAPEGAATEAGDCDDADADFHPGALETDCADPNDYNCDGSIGFEDGDADGFPACEDCDDAAATTNPDADEVCGGADEDCDGETDERGATGESTFYLDHDGDAHGDPVVEVQACAQPEGHVTVGDDCDDRDADAFPGATEVCDGRDGDCDGEVDEDASDASAWYADADGDGYGDAATTQTACEAPVGYVADATDCDDGAKRRNPNGVELCNGADDDCDGETDEADATDAPTWYADADADGYGDGGDASRACEKPSGRTADGTDCDDGDPDVHPTAGERCNDADDDCDGDVDEFAVDATERYYDADRDGYGGDTRLASCDPVAGYVDASDDCDDDDDTIHPDADRACGGDHDCDGTEDDDQVGPGGGPTCVAASCAEVLAGDSGAEDGVYWLAGKGGTPFEGWCEMTFDGGGWLAVYNFPQLAANNTSAATMHASLITNEAMSAPVAPDTRSEAIYTKNVDLSKYTEVVYAWAPSADSDPTRYGTYERSAGLAGQCYVDGYCGASVALPEMTIQPTGSKRVIYTGNSPTYPHVGLGFSGQIIVWGYDNNASSYSNWANWYDLNPCCNAGNTSDITNPGWRYAILIR